MVFFYTFLNFDFKFENNNIAYPCSPNLLNPIPIKPLRLSHPNTALHLKIGHCYRIRRRFLSLNNILDFAVLIKIMIRSLIFQNGINVN